MLVVAHGCPFARADGAACLVFHASKRYTKPVAMSGARTLGKVMFYVK